jgi:hypothetical protein
LAAMPWVTVLGVIISPSTSHRHLVQAYLPMCTRFHVLIRVWPLPHTLLYDLFFPVLRSQFWPPLHEHYHDGSAVSAIPASSSKQHPTTSAYLYLASKAHTHGSQAAGSLPGLIFGIAQQSHLRFGGHPLTPSPITKGEETYGGGANNMVESDCYETTLCIVCKLS